METALTVICLFVVLPAMVLWYLDRQRRHDRESGSPSESPANLADLARQAERMEKRIQALEALLDAEAPDWRKRDGH